MIAALLLITMIVVGIPVAYLLGVDVGTAREHDRWAAAATAANLHDHSAGGPWDCPGCRLWLSHDFPGVPS